MLLLDQQTNNAGGIGTVLSAVCALDGARGEWDRPFLRVVGNCNTTQDHIRQTEGIEKLQHNEVRVEVYLAGYGGRGACTERGAIRLFTAHLSVSGALDMRTNQYLICGLILRGDVYGIHGICGGCRVDPARKRLDRVANEPQQQLIIPERKHHLSAAPGKPSTTTYIQHQPQYRVLWRLEQDQPVGGGSLFRARHCNELYHA